MAAGRNKELNEHAHFSMLHLITQNIALNHVLCTTPLSYESQMLLEPLKFAL